MGVLSNKIQREKLKNGDHIYTWRRAYIYAHHGIYVGDGMVIHFTQAARQETGAGNVFDDLIFSSVPFPLSGNDCTVCGDQSKDDGIDQKESKVDGIDKKESKLDDNQSKDDGIDQKESKLDDDRSKVDGIDEIESKLDDNQAKVDGIDKKESKLDGDQSKVDGTDKKESKFDGDQSKLDGFDKKESKLGGDQSKLDGIDEKESKLDSDQSKLDGIHKKKSKLDDQSKLDGDQSKLDETHKRKSKLDGVISSCLDCFLSGGDLYLYEYGVNIPTFLAEIRGGTCTLALADPEEQVVHRAKFLLANGFGDYDLLKNNCIDFAIYCKTSLLVDPRISFPIYGQVASLLASSSTFIASKDNKLLSLAKRCPYLMVVGGGLYVGSRYFSDIGVRRDAIKIAVEDLVNGRRF